MAKTVNKKKAPAKTAKVRKTTTAKKRCVAKKKRVATGSTKKVMVKKAAKPAVTTEDKFSPVALDSKWRKKTLSKSSVKKAYDKLEEEYSVLNEMLKARSDAGLTQKQLAKKMGKQQPSIARLERTLSDPDGSVSLAFLKDYAEACGKKVRIEFVD